MYTRTTGIKVDDKKIIGKHISTESSNQIASSFNDYYRSITLTDRKDAITSAIDDDNMKNTITVDNKGKKQIYSKQVLTKNSKLNSPTEKDLMTLKRDSKSLQEQQLKINLY